MRLARACMLRATECSNSICDGGVALVLVFVAMPGDVGGRVGGRASGDVGGRASAFIAPILNA